MVDLGQKKVDSYPPFFMTKNQIKKACPGDRASFFYSDIFTVTLFLWHI
jgi:uncharacterized protein Veg